MTDRLIVNADVLTFEPDAPRARAVAIRGDRIAAVGTEAEARAAVGRDAEAIDAGGRTVLPGLIDAHNHYLSTAESLACVNVRYPEVASTEDLVEAIAAAARELPAGRLVRAFGLDWARFDVPPTRFDLDAATTEHPVVVHHVSGHHAVVNSRALAERGIGDDVRDPAGGAFVRDAAGRLTGLCLDAAMDLILPVALDIGCHGPNFHTRLPLAELVELLAGARAEYFAAGLTTVCDPQVTRRELAAYREAHRQGVLGPRTVCMPLSHALDELESLGLAGPFGDDRLRLGGMKLYADGTLIGGTAAFSEPYGRHGEFHGSLYWTPEELSALVLRAHRAGWQVGIHTQGDRAMQATVDALAGALRVHPRDDARHRIEHCGYPTPAQLGEIAALGVIPVSQPSFLVDSGDDFLERLDGRAHRLQPLRDELDAGLRPVLSSDSFVATLRPLETIQASLLRRTREGRPIGADQRLTLEEALRAHTIDAAYALGMEDRIGSLRPGKLADLAVIDGPLLTTPEERIADLGIWTTVLDGELVWRRTP